MTSISLLYQNKTPININKMEGFVLFIFGFSTFKCSMSFCNKDSDKSEIQIILLESASGEETTN